MPAAAHRRLKAVPRALRSDSLPTREISSMKHAKYLVALALFAFAVTAFAQERMDSRAERAVHITQGPSIIRNNGSTAVLEWTTDHESPNNVEYRRAGSNEGWRKAYHPGG